MKPLINFYHGKVEYTVILYFRVPAPIKYRSHTILLMPPEMKRRWTRRMIHSTPAVSYGDQIVRYDVVGIHCYTMVNAFDSIGGCSISGWR